MVKNGTEHLEDRLSSEVQMLCLFKEVKKGEISIHSHCVMHDV